MTPESSSPIGRQRIPSISSRFGAEIAETALRFRIVVAEAPEGAEVPRPHAPGVFHLQRPEHSRPVEDEVHFAAGPAAEEVETRSGGPRSPGAGEPAPQVLRHQSLQGRAPDLLRPVEGPGGTQRTEDAGVREVELGMRRSAPSGSSPKHRDPEREQQVFEELQIALDRFPTDRALPRHVAQVQDSGVGEGDGLQEPPEAVEVPHQPFGLHLLFHIEGDIGGERVLRVPGVPDEGQQSVREGRFQVEGISEFGGEERMHPPNDGASRQQIHPGPPQYGGRSTRSTRSADFPAPP